MKKIFLLLVLFSGIFTLNAQNKEVEIHVANIFQCLQKNDASCYQNLWIDEATFTELYKKSFGTTVYDSPLYFRSLYLSYQAQMLGSFTTAITNIKQQSGENLNNLTLKKIHITKDESSFWQAENTKAAIILLENKSGKKQWIMNISNIHLYKNEIYDGAYRNFQVLQDISFEDLIIATKAFDEKIVDDAESAKKNDEQSKTDEIIISDVDFKGSLKNKKIQFHFEMTHSLEKPNYENCYYLFSDQYDKVFFQKIIHLGDDQYLFVEKEGNYFHLKRVGGKFIGTYFSLKDDKKYSVSFAKYED